MLLGGLRNGTQTFSRQIAGSNAALLVLAAIGLFIPAVFAPRAARPATGSLIEESVLVALLLIVGYVVSLVFQFTNPAETLGGSEPRRATAGRPGRPRSAVFVLLVAGGLLAVLSEILVGAIEPFIERSACPSSSSA